MSAKIDTHLCKRAPIKLPPYVHGVTMISSPGSGLTGANATVLEPPTPPAGVGMVFAGGDRIRADHNVAENNTIYGITAFASSHGLSDHNTVTDNTNNGDKCIS